MTLRKNIVANYIGTGVVALAPILALPWYLAALGPKQFGLVSFVAMLQALLGLLDAGMSQSLAREFTLCESAHQRGTQGAATLLRSFERVYWIFAMLAMCLILPFSGVLASNWLELSGLPAEVGQWAVYGAGAIFAAQFPGSLYRSALIGTQSQVELNVVMSISALLKHIGGIVIVNVWPTLPAYLIWFVIVTLLETLFRARLAWKAIGGGRNHVVWSTGVVLKMMPLVVSLSGATILGALTIQMDKIILSKMVSVELFGYYSIAWSIAIGVLQLIYPVMNAALPKVVNMRDDFEALRSFCAKLTVVVMLVVVVGGGIFYFMGVWLLERWLNNPVAVAYIYAPLSVLLIGTAMHAIWNIGYLVWLANGKANNALFSNAFTLVLSVVFSPALITRYGLVGAAFGWLMMNVAGTALSFGWLKRKRLSVE
ncbi:Polysaccharide biosynthesis protein [Ferriphaselus amnicola]|uniref:Polysaccharide biosynthesis protein n=1 Tax=Ferriphaselus amnicola TaxID=1188319 RepID=A0A2Z6G8A4_9PROT|nr:oligosaccharide flippase family protein [Ferriphaselus amnicola]BBE49690.1 Polysaccharide biosynthesis protein [Ferriphaselus amnicola]